MTESVIRKIPEGATHLIVQDAVSVVVAIHDLSVEHPKGIYVPKGDSLHFLHEEGGRGFLARPSIDQDMTVDLVYEAIVDGSDYTGPVEVVEDQPQLERFITIDTEVATEVHWKKGGDLVVGTEAKPDWSDRHASTQHIIKYFAYDHLTNPRLRAVSAKFKDLADDMLSRIEDGPELSAGLRKLLEAKDCCVRAALD